MSIDKFTVMPCFSLNPSKLVLYNRIFNNSRYSADGTKIHTLRKSESVKRAFHNFTISSNAYRTLKTKIEWLYFLSKARYVKTYSGKEIFNYKMSFITLTLSSEQKKPTKEVTNEMFDRFLTEIRNRTNMVNYIWRLEFQDNGNVHYHLITDSYLDYYFIKKIWNRIQLNNGYIKSYQDKFSSMSLNQYWNLYKNNDKYTFDKVAKMYAKNKSENWTQPPSVDVKSVNSKSAIAYYISKYFSKDSKSKVDRNKLDNVDNSSSLRLWFCSRSLSKLSNVSDFIEAVYMDFESIVSSIKDVKKVFTDYAIIYYYNLKKSSHYIRSILEKVLRDYSYSSGYIPSQ